MSLPEPPEVKRPSIISVPLYIASVIFGGGCRAAHVPVDGAVVCEECYPHAQNHIYPPAQEQSAATAVEPQPPASPQEPAPAPVTAAPAPSDAPTSPRAKKSSSDDSNA